MFGGWVHETLVWIHILLLWAGRCTPAACSKQARTLIDNPANEVLFVGGHLWKWPLSAVWAGRVLKVGCGCLLRRGPFDQRVIVELPSLATHVVATEKLCP